MLHLLMKIIHQYSVLYGSITGTNIIDITTTILISILYKFRHPDINLNNNTQNPNHDLH